MLFALLPLPLLQRFCQTEKCPRRQHLLRQGCRLKLRDSGRVRTTVGLCNTMSREGNDVSMMGCAPERRVPSFLYSSLSFGVIALSFSSSSRAFLRAIVLSNVAFHALNVSTVTGVPRVRASSSCSESYECPLCPLASTIAPLMLSAPFPLHPASGVLFASV